MNAKAAARLYLSANGNHYQRNAAYAALARWHWQRQADKPKEKRDHLWRVDAEALALRLVNEEGA